MVASVGKIRSNHIQLEHSKSTSFKRRIEFMTKTPKSNKGWKECSQNLLSLSPIFSMPIFSSAEFSILRISCSYDNAKVTGIKTHPRGFLCVCYRYITRWKATFCQRGLFVPVYICVKVHATTVGNTKILECF